MKHIFFTVLAIAALTACTTNPHYDYYNEHSAIHPELLDIQKNECLELGFKEKSKELAECRKDLAQDWKNNLEANRRDSRIRPHFGIQYGIGSRW